MFLLLLYLLEHEKTRWRKQWKQNQKSRTSVKNIYEKKFRAYSKPNKKQSWQKLKCTLENSHRKNQNIFGVKWKTSKWTKQPVLGASKNGQIQKKWKKNIKETKQRKSSMLFSLLDFYSYIFVFGLRFLFRLFRVGEI